MAPLRSGRCGLVVLGPDVESPRGCEPACIRLPTALDGDGRGGSGERADWVDPTGAASTRSAAGGRSGAGLGRRPARICACRYVGPGWSWGPQLVPSRLVPPRHFPRAELQPAHELPGDMLRQPRQQRRPVAPEPGMHTQLVLI